MDTHPAPRSCRRGGTQLFSAANCPCPHEVTAASAMLVGNRKQRVPVMLTVINHSIDQSIQSCVETFNNAVRRRFVSGRTQLSISSSLQTSRITCPSTSPPRSEMPAMDAPKRQITCSTRMRATVAASLLRLGNASAHLLNGSMQVTMYTNPLRLRGCGPVRSKWSFSNGAPDNMGCNCPVRGN